VASDPSKAPDEPLDPDIVSAEERTELSWNRSGLAVLICILVLLRHLWPLDRNGRVAALTLMAVGAVIYAIGLQTARRLGGREPMPPMSSTTGRLLSLGTVVLAAGAFVLGFFPPR
jgi:uncharacterized membrane protein YidH (DUF202 family)